MILNQIELGSHYPLVNGETTVNKQRWVRQGKAPFITRLGRLEETEVLIVFKNELEELFATHAETQDRMRPWVHKPLGEVELQVRSTREGYVKIIHAPVTPHVACVLTADDQYRQAELLKNYSLSINFDTLTYRGPLYGRLRGNRGQNWIAAGDLLDPIRHVPSILLLPDNLEKLARGTVQFFRD